NNSACWQASDADMRKKPKDNGNMRQNYRISGGNWGGRQRPCRVPRSDERQNHQSGHCKPAKGNNRELHDIPPQGVCD
ncbi:MAG: hypothetical protein AAFU86_07910, partial [Pseudomonadota bacterium]